MVSVKYYVIVSYISSVKNQNNRIKLIVTILNIINH